MTVDPPSTYNSICASTGVNDTKLQSRHRRAGMVMANPSLVPNNQVHSGYVPGRCERFLPGQRRRQLFLRHLRHLRRQLSGHAALSRTGFPGSVSPRRATCATKFGCYTFFAPQGSSMPTWMNAGDANYHAMTVSLRRAFSSGRLVRFQLHAFAFHRQRVGRRGLLRPGRRGDPKHIQSRANSAARPISISAIR